MIIQRPLYLQEAAEYLGIKKDAPKTHLQILNHYYHNKNILQVLTNLRHLCLLPD